MLEQIVIQKLLSSLLNLSANFGVNRGRIEEMLKNLPKEEREIVLKNIEKNLENFEKEDDETRIKDWLKTVRELWRSKP